MPTSIRPPSLRLSRTNDEDEESYGNEVELEIHFLHEESEREIWMDISNPGLSKFCRHHSCSCKGGIELCQERIDNRLTAIRVTRLPPAQDWESVKPLRPNLYTRRDFSVADAERDLVGHRHIVR
jgi:hypothetical protein